VTVITLFSY